MLQLQMIEIHRNLKKMSSLEADIKFLMLASSLPMYGCHFYPGCEKVLDENGNKMDE